MIYGCRDAYPAEESNISELIKEFQDLRHEHDALMADIKELKEWHNIHIIYRLKLNCFLPLNFYFLISCCIFF